MEYQHYFRNNSSHRRFRQEVGASALRQDKYIRTLKFPLEAPENGWTFDFEQAAALFNTTEGLGKGSLAGFLFCVLLSGGRLFSKGPSAQLHRIRDLLPGEDFTNAFQAVFGRDCGNFNPAGIIDFFSKEQRSRISKKEPFTSTALTGDIYRLGSANGKLPSQEKEVDERLLEIAELTANLVLDAGIDNWGQLRNRVPDCLKALDTALASLSYHFPQLASCTAALKPMRPDNSTLDFSPVAMTIEQLDEALMPYQVMAAQAHIMRSEGIKVDKSGLQKRVTTETHMAMSWLFNNGLSYWSTTPLIQIVEDYELSDADHWKAKRIQEWARAIPRDALYGEAKYDKYRSAVGGKIDSWIGNYWARLDILDGLFADLDTSQLTLHPDLFSDAAKIWFSGQSVSAEDLQAMITRIDEQKAKAMEALAVLRGEREQLPDARHIQTFESFSELMTQIVGEVELLNNRLAQEKDKAGKQADSIWNDRIIKKPKWLKALPKVPGLSGGVPDYLSEIEQAFDRYQSLMPCYLETVNRITKTPDWPAIVMATIAAERQHLMNYKDAATLDYQALAAQKLWNQYINEIRKTDLATQQRVIERMMAACIVLPFNADHVQPKDRDIWQRKQQRKLLNELILNQKGRVYVSPFSRGRHQPVALDTEKLTNTDLLSWIDQDLALWQQQDSPESFRMRHDWQILKARMLLRALPDHIPSSLLKPESLAGLPVPPLLRIQLEQAELSAGVVNKALNLYTSDMRGLLAVIFRESFFLRTRFTRVGDNEILYVPKTHDCQWIWQAPEQWLRSDKPATKFVYENGLESAGAVELVLSNAGLKPFGKNWNRGNNITGPLLKEMPHDWYLELGFDKRFDGHDTTAVVLDKKKLGKPSVKKQACRLIGGTAFKGWLDRQLTDNKVTHGDYTLIIEQHFTQKLEWQAGKPVVSVSKDRLELSVALPITQEADEQAFDITETYIGIDLGEAGIGYAVVSAYDHELIEYGEIPIPSTKALIRAVKQHRKLAQPRQKFAQKFDTSLMELRENVVGDTTHVINSLMHKFKGAPILESSVRNLASGSKQLQLVYDKVLNLYTFSGTDAHKAARRHFWCGADKWEVSGVNETVRDGDNKTRTGEPKLKTRKLLLYPGSHVHPAGTSQVCSACGHNPYKLLETAYENHTSLTTNDQGILDLGGQQLLLLTRTSGSSKRHRRQSLRAPFDQPLKNKTLTLDDAKKQVRSQLRRAPDSLRSKDTSQSRYHCAVVGCGHSMHADANAAINIVRKWLSDRSITKRS